MLDDDVWVLFCWWRDWEDFRALPFGGSDVMAQPAYVVEVLRICRRTAAEVRASVAREHERAVEQQLAQLRGTKRG